MRQNWQNLVITSIEKVRRKKELRAKVSGLSECLKVCYLLKINAEEQLDLWIMGERRVKMSLVFDILI